MDTPEPDPEIPEGPWNPFWSGWDGRNHIDDPTGFLYGRYLFRIVDVPRETLDLERIGGVMELRYDTAVTNYPHQQRALPPRFFDCPYTAPHLTYHTCSQVATSHVGYKANPRLAEYPGGRGEPRELEPERKDLYKSLLRQAINRLDFDIAQGTFGNVTGGNDTLTVNQKMIKEIVVNASATLKEMFIALEGTGCQNPYDSLECTLEWFWEITNGGAIRLKSCPVPNGTSISYNHDEDTICIKPSIAVDCQSKRMTPSHAAFNLLGFEGDDSSCYPSYGHWAGTGTERGLYETGYETDPGFELFVTSTDNGDYPMLDARPLSFGDVSADGYAAVIVSKVAHELCHAYFRRHDLNRMIDWPSPESLWEEEQCTMTEALIYKQLAKLGYWPTEFTPELKEFVRSVTHHDYNHGDPLAEAVVGRRFAFMKECRGYGGLFLGTYCANMYNIAQSLSVLEDADWARALAFWNSQCPTLNPPEHMSVRRVQGPFVYPEGEPEPVIDPEPIINPVPILDEPAEGGTP